MSTDNPTHAELVKALRKGQLLYTNVGGANIYSGPTGLERKAASFIESQASRIEELEAALRAASEVVDVAEKLASCRADDDCIWSVQETVRAALGGKP